MSDLSIYFHEQCGPVEKIESAIKRAFFLTGIAIDNIAAVDVNSGFHRMDIPNNLIDFYLRTNLNTLDYEGPIVESLCFGTLGKNILTQIFAIPDQTHKFTFSIEPDLNFMAIVPEQHYHSSDDGADISIGAPI